MKKYERQNINELDFECILNIDYKIKDYDIFNIPESQLSFIDDLSFSLMNIGKYGNTYFMIVSSNIELKKFLSVDLINWYEGKINIGDDIKSFIGCSESKVSRRIYYIEFDDAIIAIDERSCIGNSSKLRIFAVKCK